MKKLLFLTITLIVTMSLPAQARRSSAEVMCSKPKITNFFTTLGGVGTKTEGNNLNGKQLVGYNGRNVDVFCRYGIGVQNYCLAACETAAGGGMYSIGSTYPVPEGTMCNGHEIHEVRVVDRGSKVNGCQLDIFAGICEKMKLRYNKKKRKWYSTGLCDKLASPNVMADYDAPPGRDGGLYTHTANLRPDEMPPTNTQVASVAPAPAPAAKPAPRVHMASLPVDPTSYFPTVAQ